MGLQRGKNDQLDSEQIALYAYRFEDRAQLGEPKNPVLERLQQLNATRTLLVKISTMLQVFLSEKQYCLDSATSKVIKGVVGGVINCLALAIGKIDGLLEAGVKQDKSLQAKHEQSMSVTGIGKVVSLALLIKTSGYQKCCSAQQLSCYMGIAGFEHVSGSSIRVRTRVSIYGVKDLKSLLHMGILPAIRNCKELQAYYECKVASVKPKMLVLNAIRNKLVSRVYACIRDGRQYEATYSKGKVA